MICQNCGHNDGKKMSTPAQRNAYFGLAVKALANHHSCHKNEMHKALAGAFFGFVDIQIGPMVIKVPATTTGRTTKEFKEFYEFIQEVASKDGVDIPSPNEGAPAGYK